MRRASDRVISAKLEATRSLIPASLSMSAESRASLIAVATKVRMMPLSPASSLRASLSVRALSVSASAMTTRRLAIKSSKNLAMEMVQVTSEAKTRLHMIAWTKRLADMNIDQGDNSLKPTAIDRPAAGLALCTVCGLAGAAVGDGADGCGAELCAAAGRSFVCC